MAQTAMAILIEYVTKYEEVIGVTATMVKDKAQSLLPKEKQQIIDATHIAYREGVKCDMNWTGEDYFNHTFTK